MGFFEDLREIRDVTTRQVESMGGVYSDPFNEIATVVAVSDPKKLGRVKVTYQDGGTSDWIYVLNGSNKGLLSAQFIGSPCLIGKANGNSEDAFVLGFFNKSTEAGFPGAAYQIATVSEQMDAYRSAASPGDQGLLCNEANSGRLYLFDNEMSGQVLAICKRRDNRQQGEEAVWSWNNLTPGRYVEKGVDPGVPEGTATSATYAGKTGIPKCSRALDGEVVDFSEDRKFRSFQIKCGKDENGEYVWSPLSASPVFFRTTLPPCTERLHGMDAIIDEGLNSQGVKCLRYQGSMKWVNPGKREPIQFHSQDPPPTKEEFIDSRQPIKALAQAASPASGDFIGKAGGAVISAFSSAIPLLSSSEGFNATELLSSLGRTALAVNAGVSVSALTSQLTSALSNGNVIDDQLATVLNSLGGAGDTIARGLQNGTLDSALQTVGQKSLGQALSAVPPELRSVYASFAAGGALGAIDSVAMLGLSQLPSDISSLLSPALDLGRGLLNGQPLAINDMVNAAVGVGSRSVPDIVSGLVGVAGGEGNISRAVVDAARLALQGGSFGEVAGMIGNFVNIPGIPLLGGAVGLPQLATTALELVGLGEQFSGILGSAGIGLDALGALTGSNPVSAILGGLGGLSGLFGGGGDECPCDPKCRKTKHSEDSDGSVLLEKCGNVIANSASSYSPDGDPTKNNENAVAKLLDLIPTKLGEDACIPNQFDLTQLIQNVKRLGEMADRLEGAKNADWPELWSELMYTFETIEKTFKQTDNNITKVESVERKLIDAQYRLINKLMVGSDSIVSKTLLSIITTSKAIQDVYTFIAILDATKVGGRAGVFPTQNLVGVFKNITSIAALNAFSKKEALFISEGFLKTADREWRLLEPASGLVDLTSFILGLIPKDLPIAFDKCVTKRDKNKVLNDSLQSKINSPTPPTPESLFSSQLPPSVIDRAETDPSISSLLNQIKYDQGRAQTGQADC
jgi:hypothetical protein